MLDVIIIGSGCLARECRDLLRTMMRAAPGLEQIYRFRGVVRWPEERLAPGADYPMLGDAASWPIGRQEIFVLGLELPAMRKAAYTSFKERGASFLTLVHPWTDISPDAALGEGNIFQWGSSVYCDSTVGNGNYFGCSMNVSHDAVIGDFNVIGPAVFILGQCRVGNANIIAAQSVLLPRARMGSNNCIAPGSFVYKGCGDGCLMSGNPALNQGKLEHTAMPEALPW